MTKLAAEQTTHASKWSGRVGFSENEFVGLVQAERHAVGVSTFQLRIAQVFAGLVEAVLAAARVELLPRTAYPVEKCLCDAVQHTGPVPVAGIAGQAG